MFLALLLLAQAQAITYDVIKEYNCYTLRGRYSKNELICGVAIDENDRCEEMCRTRETLVRMYPGSPRDFTVATGEHLCEVSFTGQCATRAFGRDSGDLCLTLGQRDLPYNEAVRDCERNGGRIYVPDSDYELNKLIELIEGEVDRLWLGGGSIFFRQCRDAAQGKTEEVAVMYMITKRDNRFLGYATTRITSERAAYVCAAERRQRNEDRRCLGDPDQTPPTTTTVTSTTTTTPAPTPWTPPRCSFATHTAYNPTRIGQTACFNDGSLKIGDKLVFEGITPPCCPSSLNWDRIIWSFQLYSSNKSPIFVGLIMEGWQNLRLTTAKGGWNAVPQGQVVPCPFKPSSSFTIEITNNQDNLEFVLNGQRFTHNHPVAGDHGNQYYYLAVGSYPPTPLKLNKVAVVRNGVRSEIGL